MRHRHGVVAADRDQRIAAVPLQVVHAALQSAFALGRIRARRAQNGSTARQNSRYLRQVENLRFVVLNASPAFQEPHELIAIMKRAFAHDRANHRVQAGTIASAG